MSSNTNNANVGAKIHNLVHASPSSCLRISPKSNKLLATGTTDCRVHVWVLGKTVPVMTLNGLASPVASLALDYPEQFLIAGSAAGPIRLWDLGIEKVVRSLQGHKSATRAVEFHPFGDFFASAGADSLVKVWDLRKKGCIQTYHSNAPSSPASSCSPSVVRITPDGRWIASGWDDGSVKIWDMTAGKLLKTFTDSSHPVTCLTFSPYEFIMTVAYQDGRIWFYNLETFLPLEATQPLSSVPKCIEFHESGKEVLIACQDSIQVWGWDPLICYDSVAMEWPNLADIKMLEDNKLVGASLDGNMVGVWGLKLDRLKPYRPSLTQLPPLRQIPKEPPSRTNSSASLHNGAQPIDEFSRSDGRDGLSRAEDRRQHSRAEDRHQPSRLDDRDTLPPKAHHGSTSRTKTPNISRDSTEFDGAQPKAFNSSHQHQYQDSEQYSPPSNMQSLEKKRTSFIGASGGNVPLNLDITQFARHGAKSRAPSNPPPPNTHQSSSSDPADNSDHTDENLIESLTFRNTSMTLILTARLRALQDIRSVWDESNVKPALEMMLECRDAGVRVDILRLMNMRAAKVFTLDVAIMVLPLLSELLFEVYEDYIIEACATLKLLCKSFAPLILSQLGTSYTSPGIDISREDRQKKCLLCYNRMMDVKLTLQELARSPGRVGASVRDALVELSVFGE
ncbi:Katanin p80 WD40 repeat-containing subunit B1 [Chytriomyces hyalinus]|nr:Katanin p80 WD40 repeat-containing subunit B1 [Chytriomyces hyalinus]